LRRRYFRERQTDITSELETLMSALDLKRKQGFGSSPAEAAVHQLRGTQAGRSVDNRTLSPPGPGDAAGGASINAVRAAPECPIVR